MVMHGEASVRAVVVNLNGGAYIGEAIESLRRQDYPHLTTVVVDNGSTDGSVAWIRRTYPDVMVRENHRNLGFGGANNVGIEDALRENDHFVFLLNYDARIGSSCLSTLVAAAVSAGAGMVGPKIFYHDPPSLIWSAGGSIHWWRGSVAHRGIREQDRGTYDVCTEVDYLTACAVLLDAGMLRRIGMFDDAFFPSYFEDTDLCQRAKRAGYRLLFEPRGEAWHRVSAHSGGGTTALKVRLRFRNQFVFFRRYARWYHWSTIPVCAGLTAGAYLLRWIGAGQWNLVRALVKGAIAASGGRAATRDRGEGAPAETGHAGAGEDSSGKG